MRHAAGLLLLLLLLSPRPAAGQVIICSGYLEPITCTGPVTTSMRFHWDAPYVRVEIAQAQVPHVYVDNATTFHPLGNVLCDPNAAGGSRCSAAVLPSLAAVLSVAGSHTVAFKIYDPATGEESAASVPFRLAVPAGCALGSETRFVGTPFGERNQLSTLNLATRVATLRAAGWRIEWSRVQYAADAVPSNGSGGYWYLVGVCVGVPQ